jgi:hypothetical protein
MLHFGRYSTLVLSFQFCGQRTVFVTQVARDALAGLVKPVQQ